jgi:tetratricopeptide (TPR) repeat protein
MAGRTATSALVGGLVVLGALWGPVRPAEASDLDDFQVCRAAYEAREWARSVTCFEELVGGEISRLTSPSLTLESRKYLAAAYYLVGRREAAATQFERLLRSDPSYELDAASFPVEVVELFTHVREQIRDELREAEEREAARARREYELARIRALIAHFEEEVEVEVENSRWAAAIPFGVGQFDRGDGGLGAFFLVSESALVVTTAVSLGFWVYAGDVARSLGPCGGDPTCEARYAEVNRVLVAMEATNWLSIGALVLLAGGGILEAQLNFRPTRTVRHRRSVPPELLEGLELSVLPGGISLRLSF